MERLILRRLANQRLLGSNLPDAPAVVAWLGAVQAQEYAAARWSLGQRTAALTASDVDAVFNAGTILRTHVLRPTWHFVTPADIGWMLTLTAPRVQQVDAHAYRQFELDASTRSRARTLIARALKDGAALTRAELARALRRGGIVASGPRLGLIAIDAEVSKVMCSGPLRDRQFTYASWDTRVPRSKTMPREEALAALTRRYFVSRGPATVKDFAWWSGLTIRDVKIGIELLGKSIERERRGDVEYWSVETGTLGPHRGPLAHLLPTYDEYLIAYKDRDVIGSSRFAMRSQFTNHLAIDGMVAGAWRAAASHNGFAIEAQFRRRLTRGERDALDRAIERYGSFLEAPVTLKEREAGERPPKDGLYK